MKRKTVVAALLGIAVCALAVSLRSVEISPPRDPAQQKATETRITIDNFSFSPEEITVAPGTTITWVNHDDVPHTVVSTDKKFKSKALDTDDTFSFTFKDPGTYEYFCSLHPKMTAKVTVK